MGYISNIYINNKIICMALRFPPDSINNYTDKSIDKQINRWVDR